MSEMIVVLAIDALEYSKVVDFGCKNLMQEHYGKTDISDFSEPRTMVLWSSFMTGENKEKEILSEGNKEMWNKRWDIKETFFSRFRNPKIIDLPGFSYDLKVHEKSRNLLKKFFESESKDDKDAVKKEYNENAFSHHRKIKEEFIRSLSEGYDLIIGYFAVADVIGHLNFGNKTMMKMIYRDLDDLAGNIRKIPGAKLIIISDHGMEQLGDFGDHSGYGFWSTNFSDLGKPKITEIKDAVEVAKDES